MQYDYFTINYASVSGFIFLLIFLLANASLDHKIKRIFYALIFLEFIEMLAYSLELWTTTFETLSPLRLWLSAIGYSVRPFIFCLILMLATRNTTFRQFPKKFYLPAVVNAFASFSVFFTDIVYSYTPDNQFHRGPLGYFTHIIIVLYLVILTVVVIRSHAGRPALEVLIIFAISLLVLFGMVIEALFSIRTIGRTSIIMVTIFYYMFFQTQLYHSYLSRERSIRHQLEQDNRTDASTGVLTKKAFTDSVTGILQAQDTHSCSSIGFVFLDLDHLKKLNDTLGHSIGDIAIAEAADTIRTVFRKTDLIGRFGGDEFYVLIPDISRERLNASLNEVQFLLQKEYSVGNTAITVSASIGAVYTENVRMLSYEQLLKVADDALYEAKASGRNCHIIKEL